jgi:hypothetical protein
VADKTAAAVVNEKHIDLTIEIMAGMPIAP